MHVCYEVSLLFFFLINSMPYRICSVAAPRQYFLHNLANKGSPQRDQRSKLRLFVKAQEKATFDSKQLDPHESPLTTPVAVQSVN